MRTSWPGFEQTNDRRIRDVPDQLIVITGAGASRDATNRFPQSEEFRPPLVTELFTERPAFTQILAQYPDAQSLAPDLRAASLSTDGIGLETYLREHIIRSPQAYDRRRYSSIPLYLQHLLHDVSRHFTTHPVNYDRLVNATLRSASEVVFVTLNYDTILDGRLSLHSPIAAMDDYVRPGGHWSLIKLHGSTNWTRRVLNDLDETADSLLVRPVASLGEALSLSEEIEFSDQENIAQVRNPDAGVFRYPALSVPLGPEDELNCPDDHVSFLRERLQAADGLHVLTIGYSGLDSALLRLLRDSGNSLRSLLAVNLNRESASEASARIARAFSRRMSPDGTGFESSFEAFARSDAMQRHLSGL
jgi:hypothetical protein